MYSGLRSRQKKPDAIFERIRIPIECVFLNKKTPGNKICREFFYDDLGHIGKNASRSV